MTSKEDILHKAKQSLIKLQCYVEQENYLGYDPYDVHNSSLPIKKFPHKAQFVLSQANKRSPINLRRVLKIKKAYHTKAMALFLAGYSNLIALYDDAKAREKTALVYNWLKCNKSTHYADSCWGFDYDYSSRQGFTKKGHPTVVHHKYVLLGLLKYYNISPTKNLKELIDGLDDFVINHIPRNYYPNGSCFGYHPSALNGCCYNASLKAAECLAVVDHFKNETKHLDLVKSVVQYVVSRQHPTGVWHYSHGVDPQKEKRQIDFHQGFILDSLDEINKHTRFQFDSMIKPAILRGLHYYHSVQFDQQGRCHYRYPQKYPTDIHNQAQGIITFSRFSDIKPEYAQMADKIVDWTISNMQDKNGYFYYQKYKWFTNKIPHIRWGQAWMFYALTEYLQKTQTNSL